MWWKRQLGGSKEGSPKPLWVFPCYEILAGLRRKGIGGERRRRGGGRDETEINFEGDYIVASTLGEKIMSSFFFIVITSVIKFYGVLVPSSYLLSLLMQ